jgi:hypothetical protein
MTALFPLVVGVLVVCAVAISRTAFRNRRTYREMIQKATRLSPAGVDAIRSGRRRSPDPIPETWFDVADLMRIRKNSSIHTQLARSFHQVTRRCTDEPAIEEMSYTYRQFSVNHWRLTTNLILAFAGALIGKRTRDRFSVNMAETARHYAEEVLLIEDMAEVIDESCLPLLEGQFFHGT